MKLLLVLFIFLRIAYLFPTSLPLDVCSNLSMEKLTRREFLGLIGPFGLALLTACARGFAPPTSTSESATATFTRATRTAPVTRRPPTEPPATIAPPEETEAVQGTATRELEVESEYPWHRDIVATVFWVGEGATVDNDFITNAESAWVTDWAGEFGGIDDPDNRNPDNPNYPAGFIPKQNPFYFALPAAEYDENGLIPGAREASPWGDESPSNGSLFKNRWVEVVRRLPDGKDYRCYAQWEDVGPAGQDGSVQQYDYVFGTGEVDNTFGLGAGIDLSPACAINLGMDKNVSNQSGVVDWRFIDLEDVPDGPWKEIVSTSGPNWR